MRSGRDPACSWPDDPFVLRFRPLTNAEWSRSCAPRGLQRNHRRLVVSVRSQMRSGRDQSSPAEQDKIQTPGFRPLTNAEWSRSLRLRRLPHRLSFRPLTNAEWSRSSCRRQRRASRSFRPLTNAEWSRSMTIPGGIVLRGVSVRSQMRSGRDQNRRTASPAFQSFRPLTNAEWSRSSALFLE